MYLRLRIFPEVVRYKYLTCLLGFIALGNCFACVRNEGLLSCRLMLSWVNYSVSTLVIPGKARI